MIHDVAIWAAAIAVGFFFAVAFYESLADRDVLVAPATDVVRRLTRSRSAVTATHMLTIVIAVPVLVVVWALVLEAALTVIGSPDNTAIAETAVAVVAAARLLAYLRQKTAHELSKAIPLALALSLLLGGLPRIEDNLQTFTDGTYQSGITIEMLVFLLALEIALRLFNDLTRASASAIRRAADRHRSDEPRDDPPHPDGLAQLKDREPTDRSQDHP